MTALQGFEWLAYLSFFASAWLGTFGLVDGKQAAACGVLAGLVLIVRASFEMEKKRMDEKEVRERGERIVASAKVYQDLADEMHRMNEAMAANREQVR